MEGYILRKQNNFTINQTAISVSCGKTIHSQTRADETSPSCWSPVRPHAYVGWRSILQPEISQCGCVGQDCRQATPSSPLPDSGGFQSTAEPAVWLWQRRFGKIFRAVTHILPSAAQLTTAFSLQIRLL